MSQIFLSVGDLSGDIHCALLVRELLRRHPNREIHALGGTHVAQAGAHLLGDTSGLGVIGFASALAVVPRSLKLKKRALNWIETHKPAAAILCDWGGFNTRLLPDLKRLNVPVLYYFPPRSWQKRGDGGLQIAPFCERIATPFEWSAERLSDAGARADWVGHPILERIADIAPREELRAKFGIGVDERLVVALPGSRPLELSSIAPHVARACEVLAKRGATILVAAAPGAKLKLEPLFRFPNTQIVEGQSLELLRAADAAIVKSGTSTLEAAATNTPQIVVYDVPPLLRAQVHLTGLRRKIPFVAMPNIILEREIVPELLGEKCRARFIVDEIESVLETANAHRMREDYARVRAALGEGLPYTATARTADFVDEIAS